ncbi:hypothetical protein VTN49DRAFT_3770 [Thermomyces lanuginosus]|uniref:uncharacterized protein n=1 Tax=Thermomyces lanuginosus TaxID=5541 RepID=UPI003742B103
MVFYTQFPHFPSTSDFEPLFRLMDDYLDVSRDAMRYNNSVSGSRRYKNARTVSSFTPRFDVRETKDSYLLDGELPGVRQENIEIEFSDPHTLVIKGRVSETNEATSNSNSNYHPPTVEEEGAGDKSSETNESSSSTAVQKSQAQSPAKSQEPEYKVWLSERRTGSFHRTFTFPVRVNQDGVRASLKDGILSIVVPKESAPTTKKIRIE